MNDKEKKAFVARMKKGKREAAKGKSKSKGGGKSATKPIKKKGARVLRMGLTHAQLKARLATYKKGRAC